MLDFDGTLDSETPDKSIVMKSLRDAEAVLSSWGAIPYDTDVLDQCPDFKIILYAAGSATYFLTDELLRRKIRIGTEVERMGAYCLRELRNWIKGRPLENEFDLSELDVRA